MEGRLWAEARGFLYYETSAQTGVGVADVFQALFAATVAMVTKGEKPSSRYTPEQLSLVQRIHGCQDSYDILGVSRTCSRYVWLFVAVRVCRLFVRSVGSVVIHAHTHTHTYTHTHTHTHLPTIPITDGYCIYRFLAWNGTYLSGLQAVSYMQVSLYMSVGLPLRPACDQRC